MQLCAMITGYKHGHSQAWARGVKSSQLLFEPPTPMKPTLFNKWDSVNPDYAHDSKKWRPISLQVLFNAKWVLFHL